jgi:hypothetical protein
VSTFHRPPIILRRLRTVLHNACPILETESVVVLSAWKALIGSPLHNGSTGSRIRRSPNSIDQTAAVVGLPPRVSLLHRLFVTLKCAPHVFRGPAASLEAEAQVILSGRIPRCR